MSVFEILFKYPLQTFAEGRLAFLSRMPLEVTLLLAVAAAVTAWVIYRQVSDRIQPHTRRSLLVVRSLLLTLIVFLLAAPVLSLAKPHKSLIYTAVAVDTSRSMSIADADANGPSRLEAALDVLGTPAAQNSLLGKLSDNTTVVLYGFDRELQRVADPKQFRAVGRFTNIFRSIRELEEDLRGLSVGSVLLVTDGCRNEGGSAEDAARLLAGRNIPLHVVGVGNPQPPKDYEVSRVFAPSRVRRNSEVEVYAIVRHTGYDQPFDISIGREKSILATQRIVPEKGADIQRVRLSFTPDAEGAATYSVSIPVDPGEKLKDNNSAEFTINMQDDRLPVFYIEGSPRQEYRFLRRALFRDKDFRLVSILRLSSNDAEKGGTAPVRIGGAAADTSETAAPLSAAAGGGKASAGGGKLGFYVQGANLSESYLEKGFPTRPEQLYGFQAVILGDIEATYFTPQQLAMIEEFVRVRGGGLLMLGGVNSFGLGKYAGTAVERMLPVTISPNDRPYSDETFKAIPTPQALERGNPHLLMRLSNDESINRRLWENAQPLIGITPVSGLKLGATPLLMHEKGALPVLAVQNYGQGRVAAFTSGGSWYWRMNNPVSNEFHERFWKQMVRWLVVGVKERVSVETSAPVYVRGESVALRATVLGKDLTPINDATVVASVTDPLGNAQEVPMDWILSEEGVYQGPYLPAEEGDYKIVVRVERRGPTSNDSKSDAARDDEFKDTKPAETEFRVSEPLVEFNNAGLNRDLLQQMVAIAGGRYYDYGKTDSLADDMLKAARAATQAGSEDERKPLWDMPIVFVAILVLLALEWVIRRRSGLA